MLNKSLLMLLVVVGLVNTDPYQPYGGSYSGATRYTRRQSYGNRGYYNYRNSGRYNSGTYDGPRVYTREHLNPTHQNINHHNPIHQSINNHHNPTHHTIDIQSPIHFNNEHST
ncbi:hypothetical protein Pmani_018688 [Petrolisthes manimaculis]|uniref:Uncharacterized protein n=1 Tax=Petrolisthes manimaculis TaxID=1843537 RepID=A0AAE1PJA4_9EUCA|nr:hypothetical protein Pmani_018688 [Petrolisthes manimaculis]